MRNNPLLAKRKSIYISNDDKEISVFVSNRLFFTIPQQVYQQLYKKVGKLSRPIKFSIDFSNSNITIEKSFTIPCSKKMELSTIPEYNRDIVISLVSEILENLFSVYEHFSDISFFV